MPSRRTRKQEFAVVHPLHVFRSDPFTIKVACWPEGPYAALYWTEDDRQILDENEFDIAALAKMLGSALGFVEHMRDGGDYAGWRTISGLPDLPFQVGRVVVTAGAERALFEEGMVPARELLDLHQSCKWGDADERIRRSNQRALVRGGRLLSLYRLPRTRAVVQVVTDCDRSRTTVSLASGHRGGIGQRGTPAPPRSRARANGFRTQ